MKKTLISIIAVISTALVFTACGNIEDDSNTEPKVTAADSSIVDSSTSDTTTSTTSAATTSITSADDSSSRVTTTTIVTGTDRNGSITTLIIGEGGKILSTSPNNKTTTKTTTKTTAKTTTKQVGSNNNNQNNGGNNNNNYNNNNNQNNYQPNSGGGNNGNQNNGGNNSPAPVQTNPPQTQTERKTTTTTQAPQTQPPAPVVTEKQFKDLSGLEKIENCGFDDLTKAYLKFGYGKKNVELSGYEWELIRQDIIDYGMENVNGQKDFYIDEFGGYTISFPYPVKLVVNSSYEGEEHAHYDAATHTYYYGGKEAAILRANSEQDMYDIAIETRDYSYGIYDQAMENYHTYIESTGYWIEADCTIEFNIGMMPDGGVWFLTE